jgi:hypothetical protein
MKTFDFELTLQSDAKLYCRAYCNARWEPEEYDVFRNDADRQENVKSIYDVIDIDTLGIIEEDMYNMANDVNYNTIMGMDVMTYAKGEL